MIAADPTKGVTLVTGAAGFIGSQVAERLLAAGTTVVGVDSLSSGPGERIAHDRLARLAGLPRFNFHRLDLADPGALAHAMAGRRVSRVLHLAARTNPRTSVAAPAGYLRDNLAAFLEVLEFCRRSQPEHLVFASSGSVYGGGDATASSSADPTDQPRSFYAATKKANEVMAYSYAASHGLACTALRLFNVYGPWARPDSAAMIFARAIRAGRPLPMFGAGAMSRSFSYVDDVTAAIIGAAPPPAECSGGAPFRVANVAGPVATVESFAACLELLLHARAERRMLPVPNGDVVTSVGLSDVPCRTSITEGLRRFVDWFENYEPALGADAAVGAVRTGV